ncbi:MAG: hypothetical protein AAB337_03895 [Patescibacteria group bacterium]
MERGSHDGTENAERQFFTGGKTLEEQATADAAEKARLNAPNEKKVGEILGKEFMDVPDNAEEGNEEQQAAK